jgi:ferredoxin-thioredoxin reductase catalytic subunit
MSKARQLYERLQQEGQAAGYLLNPDVDFVLDLMEGLLINEERYGYWACPCRLADGVREKDLDIICPCDYRDADLDEYGACFCALYVSDEIASGRAEPQPIPDRRGEDMSQPHTEQPIALAASGIPVWRCKVCGYLCARPRPPLRCPICKADRDRFEKLG